ncbi:MAG TPA: hypothetical protein VMF91_15985 [Bryobacteraceae bacterium]|nr:hypothetical protein [Bryobacteraceae bacterium]
MKRSINYTAVITAALAYCVANLASAQTISNSSFTAETRTAPALASLEGNIYAAWKGQSGNQIWYTSGYPAWANQNRIAGALTTKAPALAAMGSTLYVAWQGENPDPADKIYYSTSTGGSTFSAQQKVVTSSGQYAVSTSHPALAANGSMVYLAYTTESDTIMLASYTGSGGLWTIASTPASGVTPDTAPALALFGNELYLAWLEGPEGGPDNIMYASLSLSAGSWSTVSQVEGDGFVAQTSVAPALAVNTVPNKEGQTPGLEIAWTAETSTGAFTINISQLTGSGWNPPGPIPPGPLTIANVSPALVNYDIQGTGCPDPNRTYYSFDVAYTGTNNEIGFAILDQFSIMPICHCFEGKCG